MTDLWQPPDTLDPEVAYLVRQLRAGRDRAGVSLGRLAAETRYSRSSWARYLNGTTLPPRPAVTDFARLTGEPAARLLALWERAEANWSGRAATPPPAEPASARPRRRWRLPLLVGAASVLAGSVVLPFTIHPDASPPGPEYTVGCRGASCAGRNAQDMDCGLDAGSFAGSWVGPTFLELRISDQCGAAWGRAMNAATGDVVSVVDRGGHTERVVVSAGAGRYVLTPMVAAEPHSVVRACVDRAGAHLCTTWGGGGQVPMPTAATSRG